MSIRLMNLENLSHCCGAMDDEIVLGCDGTPFRLIPAEARPGHVAAERADRAGRAAIGTHIGIARDEARHSVSSRQ